MKIVKLVAETLNSFYLSHRLFLFSSNTPINIEFTYIYRFRRYKLTTWSLTSVKL